jgi:GTP-binding protein
MIIRDVKLETVCGPTSTLPVHALPEIAFAGKSNVGKSSLLNALVNRRSLARTSSEPGKTQTINFYNVNDVIFLVDLPGYGYTKASVSEREKWGKMVERYLHSSKTLKAVFVLVDIRHRPNANDKQMYDWAVESGFMPYVIATKLDKIKRSQVSKCLKEVREGLGMPADGIIVPFSAETKAGREEIWELIENAAGLQG